MNSLVIFAMFALATVSALPTESAPVVANATTIDPLLKAALDKITEIVPREKIADFTSKAYRASRNLDLDKILTKINLTSFPLSTIGTALAAVALIAIIAVSLGLAFGALPAGFLADKWHKLIGKEAEYENDYSYPTYQPVHQQYPVRFSRAMNGLLDVASDVYTAWEKYDTLNKEKIEKSE